MRELRSARALPWHRSPLERLKSKSRYDLHPPRAHQVGEIDRARAIYVHAASLSDPRIDEAFWTEWKDFEVAYGNEDTYREMLRIRRSVAASFSQLHFNTAIIDTATGAPSTGALSSAASVHRHEVMLSRWSGVDASHTDGSSHRVPIHVLVQNAPPLDVSCDCGSLSVSNSSVAPCNKLKAVLLAETGLYMLLSYSTYRHSKTRAGTVEAGMGKRKRGGDDMEALEATMEEGTRLPGFVSAGVIQSEQPPGAAADGGLAAGTEGADDGGAAASAANPEDIVLDEADEDEHEGGEGAAAEDGVAIEQKDVPNAVFGSVAGGAQPGALDRFKKRRTAEADV